MIRLWYLPRLLDICGGRFLAALPTTDLGKLQHFLDPLLVPSDKVTTLDEGYLNYRNIGCTYLRVSTYILTFY
jgi:hypothetical protein